MRLASKHALAPPRSVLCITPRSAEHRQRYKAIETARRQQLTRGSVQPKWAFGSREARPDSASSLWTGQSAASQQGTGRAASLPHRPAAQRAGGAAGAPTPAQRCAAGWRLP